MIEAKEIEKCREELCDIIASHSGRERDVVFRDMDRNYWMDALQAKEYGMIDNVLTTRKK